MSDGILWYEIGRSDGRRKAGFEHSHDLDSAYATIRALDKKVQALEADLAVVIPNRDELAKQAWDIHYELEQANKDINRLSQMLDEARKEADERVAASERSAQAGFLLWNQFLQDSLSFSAFLIAAAEAGLAERPEYAELKAMVQRMNDAWVEQAGFDLRDDPPFQQRLNELVEALRH